jgi:hypothetical protein
MALLVLFFDRLLSSTQNRIAAGSGAKIEGILEAMVLLGIIALGIWLVFDMTY